MSLTTAGLVLVVAVVASAARPERPNEVAANPSSTTLAPAEPAVPGRPATATVDESYSYDLIITGVPLRDGPDLESEITGRVEHGQRLSVLCWTTGESITNGNPDITYDDAAQYTSDRWWFVEDVSGSGFVSDVWLGRTGEDDLNTAPCQVE